MTDSSSLRALADHYRVATSYDDWAARPVTVADEVVAAVLTALGVDVSDPDAALATARAAVPLLPPTVVADVGVSSSVALTGEAISATVELEDASVRVLAVAGRELLLPDDLPIGWHRLVVVTADGRHAVATLIVPPATLPEVAKGWGWAAQLYQLRSRDSWGVGDLADLRLLTSWSGGQGAALVLVNPMHAGPPVRPLDPSPYSPSSRRFRAPQYLRPELTVDYLAAPRAVRDEVDALARSTHAANTDGRIDRDASWAAKEQALAVLFSQPATPDRSARLDAFIKATAGLREFAAYNALAEVHGVQFHDWPTELHDPRSAEVAAACAALGERLRWHAWLQLLCDEQLEAAQEAAHESGMTIGVIHDLAVGVTSYGADAWALQGVLAGGLSIGAPPDSFNQQGQYWALPPWHPTELATVGYAPFRDLIRSVLRHAGGIRIDHVLGLFRLWCVPQGWTADRGTYVYYDHRALLSVLLLEATRAGAVVVGEDLGTVAPYVVHELASRGILGNDVLWFELGPEPGTGLPKPISPEDWRALSMASLTTHDLPTAAGFLEGEHVRAREALGLLNDPAQDWAQARDEKAAWVEALSRRGLLPHHDGEPVADDVMVLALYAWLGESPARLLAGSLSDVVGDIRQPNLPGTIDEYPSWRLPVATPDGRPVLLEEIMAAPMAAQVARRLSRSDTVSVPTHPIS
ncbi:4-alpha-glucanotransferase [Acidothermaceae bacterium B102]|nr:4-alpha-glucanotransferase [Acidothermaceae bacterium B102]